MADILYLDIETRLDIPAKEMLNTIAETEPENAFVVCWPKDGGKPTYHGSTGDMTVVLFRLQQFIHNFYEGRFDLPDA